MATAQRQLPAAPSSKSPSLEEILRCGFCQKTVDDPWALPCFHNFCAACLSQLQPQGEAKTLNGSGGVMCSVCETFAKPREFSRNYLISELLALYRLQRSAGNAFGASEKQVSTSGTDSGVSPSADGASQQCSQCGLDEVPIEWVCLQCKLVLCSGCRQRHLDIPVCRTHRVVPLSDPANTKLDGPVTCSAHTSHLLDYSCATCGSVICEQCKATQHAKHKVEPVATALARTVQEIRTNLRRISENDKVRKTFLSIMYVTQGLISEQKNVAHDANQDG